MIRNKLEALALIKAAPEKLKDFKGLLDYARNIYKEVTGAFPDGIDFLTLKNAAREVANIRDPKKVVQFPQGGKDKTDFFTTRPDPRVNNLQVPRWISSEQMKISLVDQVTQREIQNTTQIF